MRMTGGLGRAGGARGEGEHGDVVPSGGAGIKDGGQSTRQLFKSFSRLRVAKQNHRSQDRALLLRQSQFIGQRAIAQRQHGLGFGDDLTQLLGTQHGHGGHRDQTCFHHGQPTQRKANRVGAANQNTVARHKPQHMDQIMGALIHQNLCLPVTQCFVGRAKQRRICPGLGQGLVQQFGHQIQNLIACRRASGV